MSVQGMPHEEMPLLGRLLTCITSVAIRFPRATVALGVLAAVASLYLCQTRLTLRTSRADLLNPKSAYNQLWLDYTKEFSDAEDVIVVVEGPSREKVIPVLDELGADLLRETRLWNTVLHKIDLTKIHAKGLFYLKPEELAGIEQFLDKFAPVLRGNWSQLNLGNMAAEMGRMLQYTPAAGQDLQAQALQQAIHREILRFLDSLVFALGRQKGYQSPWPEMSDQMGRDQATSEYLLAKEGRIGFILLRFAATSKESFVGNREAVDALRQLVGLARSRHPEMSIGVTGLPLIEHDEMSSSESSVSIATVLSIMGVFLVVLLGFGGIRHSLLPMGALTLGTIWSLGYIVLTIGHLNILSSAFGAILSGLGIDYGTYMIARYLELRKANKLLEESLLEIAGTILPGITVGMLATALSFYVAGFTDFIGVAELGFITGGGILLCWLASITVLPALICLSDKNADRGFPQPLAFHHFLTPICNYPRIVLGIGLAGTIILSLGITRVWYDHNLLHMQAKGLESVALEQKILSEGEQSACFAISIADDPRTLLERKKQFLRLPSVKNIVEIDSILAPDDALSAPCLADKQAVIQRIHGRLQNLPQQVPQLPLNSIAELGQMLAGAQAMPAGAALDAELRQRLQQIGSLFQQLPPADCYARLAQFQQSMAQDLLARLYALRAAADPQPPQLGDLPESLVARFVGRSGKHLMKIYAKGDIWDMSAMEQFVRELRSIDKSVTGNPVQIYESSLQMKRSYEQASWLALCIILPFMFLSLGNLRDAFLAVLPLGLSVLQMFGIMGFLNIPLNAANMISLPLMLGMGMDNGIHIVCDFRQQRGRYRICPSTAVAVLLNTLTTMVGYAVLMLADHRGLQNLGRVLTIGMGCYLVTSLGILPALLAWITRNRREEILTDESSLEQFSAAEYSAPSTLDDQHGDYPQIFTAEEEQPLSDTWDQTSFASGQEIEETDKDEILHFHPPPPDETQPEWSRRRSA